MRIDFDQQWKIPQCAMESDHFNLVQKADWTFPDNGSYFPVSGVMHGAQQVDWPRAISAQSRGSNPLVDL
jgi:hypothetical protein